MSMKRVDERASRSPMALIGDALYCTSWLVGPMTVCVRRGLLDGGAPRSMSVLLAFSLGEGERFRVKQDLPLDYFRSYERRAIFPSNSINGAGGRTRDTKREPQHDLMRASPDDTD